jgi:hypothetical protein
MYGVLSSLLAPQPRGAGGIARLGDRSGSAIDCLPLPESNRAGLASTRPRSGTSRSATALALAPSPDGHVLAEYVLGPNVAANDPDSRTGL